MKIFPPKSLRSFRAWGDTIGFKATALVGLAIAGSVFARLLVPVTQVILARLMGVEQFGLYTTLYALLSPVIIAASLGLDPWLLRQSGNPGLNPAIGHAFMLRIMVASGLMLLAVPVVIREFNGNPVAWLVGIAGLSLLGELIVTTADAALRAQARALTAALLQICVAIMFFSLIWLAWNPATPLQTAIMYRWAASGLGVALTVWFLRHIQLQSPGGWRATLKQTQMYFVSEILANISLKADLTITALLIGATATAIYSPALTLINITFLVPNIAAQIVLPMISRHRYGTPKYRLTVRLAILCSLLYGLCWVAILTWGAPLLVQLLYGAQYSAAVPLLRIMSVIPLMKSLNFCWVTLMVAHDNQLLRTRLQASGALFNLLGNIIWIPLLGVVGAAWVNLGTEIILLASYGYGAFKTLRREQSKLDQAA